MGDSGEIRQAVLDEARKHIGTPYAWAGRAPCGFDYSGFTSYVYAQFDITLAPQSEAQRHQGTVVSAAEALPGDPVWRQGHIGIYTGGGNHIAARNYGIPLMEGPLYRSDVTFIRVLAE